MFGPGTKYQKSDKQPPNLVELHVTLQQASKALPLPGVSFGKWEREGERESERER